MTILEFVATALFGAMIFLAVLWTFDIIGFAVLVRDEDYDDAEDEPRDGPGASA